MKLFHIHNGDKLDVFLCLYSVVLLMFVCVYISSMTEICFQYCSYCHTVHSKKKPEFSDFYVLFHQEYKALFEGAGTNSGEKTLEDKFFEHEVR